jgi:cytochrome c oxidase cbb3-type subunit I
MPAKPSASAVGAAPRTHEPERIRPQEGLRASMAVNPKKLRPYDEPPRRHRRLIPDGPNSAATGFLTVSLLWLFAATGIGAFWAAQLLFPDQLTIRMDAPVPMLGSLAVDVSPATVLAGFRDAVVFGWLSNAGFAAILFVMPRLLGVRLEGTPLAFAGLGAWNVGVAAGLVTVYLPSLAQAGPLGEFALPADGLLLLGLLAVNAVFWRPVVTARSGLPYISIWYFGIGLLALLGAYTLGAAIAAGAPFIGLNQTAVALVNAFVERAVEAYWLLGVALGTLHYVIPRVTGNPLYSGPLAIVAWVLWLGFAGLSALSGLVDPSVPYAVTSLGRTGIILMVAPIFLSVANLTLSIHGRWSLALSPGSLAYALVALSFLMATAVLEAVATLGSVQQLVRGTEWPTGVWVFATLGGFTFVLFALIDHAQPRLLRRVWGGSFLTDAQLWTTLAGTAIGGLALMATGLAHGSLLLEGTPPDQVAGGLVIFRFVAAGALGLTTLGAISAIAGLFLIYTTAPRAEYAIGPAAPAVAH